MPECWMTVQLGKDSAKVSGQAQAAHLLQKGRPEAGREDVVGEAQVDDQGKTWNYKCVNEKDGKSVIWKSFLDIRLF